MPEIITRDKVVFSHFRVTRNNGADAIVTAHFTKMSASREIPVDRARVIPLNATRQNQINAMWDEAKTFILAQEESTEFS